MLCERLTGDGGGDPELDSGGVVGSMSKDSEDERPSLGSGAKEPSATGRPSATLPAWTGDLASAPDSTVFREEEASGG